MVLYTPTVLRLYTNHPSSNQGKTPARLHRGTHKPPRPNTHKDVGYCLTTRARVAEARFITPRLHGPENVTLDVMNGFTGVRRPCHTHTFVTRDPKKWGNLLENLRKSDFNIANQPWWLSGFMNSKFK